MVKQPSIKSYFDPDVSQAEVDFAFSKGLYYAGHSLMVTKQYHYQVLPHQHNRYVLFNQGSEYNLLSNVCLHRQASLLDGRGTTRNIVCKLHCWGYDHLGNLKGAPHFTNKPEGKLEKVSLTPWHGLLFKGRAPNMDLAELGLADYLNFADYRFAGIDSLTYECNWKTFAEVYLENYHVFSMHPGLRQYVKPTALNWQLGEDYSVQKVAISDNLLKATTPLYREYQDHLLARFNGQLPQYGAIWCYIYPNIMIEWYPDVLIISTIYPDGPRRCTNHVEFYYPESLYHQNPDYFAAEKRAYMETAEEDEVACKLLEQGREALHRNGEEQHGPIEPFLEAGVAEFYRFLAQ
ncbi:Rieske 2Fe-2S domain-containing protein [Alteromonas sp. ZYF713]|nr:Rieske 2Fe-2S domain-containing protein [Alteromonas sp. ZYF713]